MLTRYQWLVIVLLFVGEALSIYSEMWGARHFNSSNNWVLFFKMMIIFTLAGGMLIGGYMLGFSAFKNIWIVTALSVGSILVVEPILAYSLFHQLPTVGALVGLILGVAGIISATFF
jgi:hypothetical protein